MASLDISSVLSAANEAVNRNGHALQQAVFTHLEDTYKEGRSRWIPVASEFPVSVRGHTTHVDLIAEQKKDDSFSNFSGGHIRRLMVCECKRVNPAFGAWVFFKTKTCKDSDIFDKRRWLDLVTPDSMDEVPARGYSTTCCFLRNLEESYHLGYEIKAKIGQSDSGGRRTTDIKEATDQVMKGVNGLINFLPQPLRKMSDTNPRQPIRAIVTPVVITTARLFKCVADLSASDLKSGELILSQSLLNEVGSLSLQYVTSPDITHEVFRSIVAGGITDIMFSTYVRTIEVVSTTGLSEWISAFNFGNDDIEPYKATGVF